MAKFCRSCGAPVEEGAEKCGSCGAQLNAPAVQVPAEQPKTNEKAEEILDKVSDVLNTSFMVVEKVLRIIAKKAVEIVHNIQSKQPAQSAQTTQTEKVTKLNVVRLSIAIVMIVLCLITMVMNITMKFDVTVTAKATYDGETRTESVSGPMDELLMEDEFIPLGLVCIVWIAFNLALVIMAIILIIKVVRLVPSKRMYGIVAMTGLIGDVIYMILYKICGNISMESWGDIVVRYSVGFHSLVWVHVVLFGLAVAWSYLDGNMKIAVPAFAEAPAQEKIEE